MSEVEWTFNDGSTETMRLTIDMYADNSNLYMGLESLDGSEVIPLTVNTNVTLGYPYSTLSADVGEKGMSWLVKQGLARPTGQLVHSTWVSFPIAVFNPDKLQEINPKAFAAYREAHGFLPDKELEELTKEAKERAAEKNALRSEAGKGRKPPELER